MAHSMTKRIADDRETAAGEKQEARREAGGVRRKAEETKTREARMDPGLPKKNLLTCCG